MKFVPYCLILALFAGPVHAESPMQISVQALTVVAEHVGERAGASEFIRTIRWVGWNEEGSDKWAEIEVEILNSKKKTCTLQHYKVAYNEPGIIPTWNSHFQPMVAFVSNCHYEQSSN